MWQILSAVLWTVSAGCVFAVLYPYLVYPLLLRRLKPRPLCTQELGSTSGREFALLFCAYNEAGALSAKLSNIQKLLSELPDIEILAYDDCSSDGTADFIDRAGLGIRVIRGAERAGKAHGMKLLVSLTDRDFLIFTDANVELESDAIRALLSDYSDPEVGGVCGILQYRDTDATTSAKTGGLYWRIDKALKLLESRSGNVMGAAGAVFSIRRSLYPEFPDTVLDDLTVSMSVIFSGYRLIEDSRVLAHEPIVASRRDDVRRRIRISTRAFHTHLWLRPKLQSMSTGDRWRYWSHRYVRWHGAFFIVLGYVSGLIALGLCVGWTATAVALLLTATTLFVGSRMRSGALSSLVRVLDSIFLTGLGVLRARRGQTMATWNPPTR